MWIERYLIVVGTLSFPRLDFNVGTYSASWVEMGILIGSIGLFGFLYFTFVQVAPIVSLWEVREGEHIQHRRTRPPPEPMAIQAGSEGKEVRA